MNLNDTVTRLQNRIQNNNVQVYPQTINSPEKASISFLQWNVQGIKSSHNRNFLIANIKNHSPDVALIQETNLSPTDSLNIPGYSCYSKPGIRGLAVAIRNPLPHQLIRPPFLGQNVETQAVEISTQEGKIYVVNVYKNCTQRRNAFLSFTQFNHWINNRPCIIAGDFNGHHPLWGSNATCATGRTIADAAQDLNLVILNSGEPTHINGGCIDLTIVSSDLAHRTTWTVMDSVVSDHFGIWFNLHVPKPPSTTPLIRRNFKKADWTLYSSVLEQALQRTDLPHTSQQLNHTISTLMNSAADTAIPSTKPLTRRKDAWYYNERVKEMKTRINQHTKLLKRHPTAENRAILRQVLNHAKTVFTEERSNKWLQWCQQLNCHTSVGDMWKHIRFASGTYTQTPTHPDPQSFADERCHDFVSRANSDHLPETTKDTLKDQHADLCEVITKALSKPDPLLDTHYTIYELLRATRPTSTTPGSDQITHSMIHYSGPQAKSAVLKLINTNHKTASFPSDWTKADTIAVPKSSQVEKVFRPISLTSCLCKLNERMILNRIIWKLGHLHPHIYGFTSGKSTADALSNLSHLATSTNSPTFVVYIDLEKAFELANPTVILALLAQRGITGLTLAWVQNFLTKRQMRVKFQGKTSQYLTLENGTPQGSVLSPLLFNLLMDTIVSDQFPTNTYVFSYADDLAAIAIGDHAYQHIQDAINTIEHRIHHLGLKISTTKTKAMAIRTPQLPTPITLSGQPIEWVSSYLYLGVIIDNELTLKPQFHLLEQKITKRLNIMRSLTSPILGATSAVLRQYYIASIRSLIDYCSPTLIIAKTTLHQNLNKLQNIAMRTILGAPRWTNILTMQSECSLISIPARIRQIAGSYLLKIMINPAVHNIATSIIDFQGEPLESSWLTEARHILRAFIPDYQHIADLPLENSPPPWIQPPGEFHIHLPTTAKKLANPHELKTQALHRISLLNDHKDAIFFTDGSVDPNNGHSGVGIVLKHPTQPAVGISHRLRDFCSSLQTELVAISIALVLAIKHHYRHIIIHTDSLNSLQLLKCHWPSDNINLVTSVRKLSATIIQAGGTVLFHWIPSHVDIRFNDIADYLAKDGANLPTINIKTLKRSKSQLKNSILNQTLLLHKDLRQTAWRQSSSLQWLHIVTDFKPLRIPRTWSRAVQTRISRLRLGYKCSWEISQPRATTCEHCQVITAQPLLHYILECPITALLFGNLISTQHYDSATLAAKRLKTAMENPNNLAQLVLLFPPPR